MIFNKIYTFLLVVGLIFPTNAAAQSKTPEGKNDGLTPELKQDALKLLSEVARESQQYNLPENRVRTQVIVADLMWEHDEQAARAIFQNALGELQNLFVNISLPDGIELNSTERSQHYNQRYKLADLRKEYVLTLAARDSQAALAALGTLKTKTLEEYDPLVADELELQVTTAIAKKDPDKSYTVAKEQLDANGLNYQFIEMLKKMHQKDSALAANLGRDVLAKIKTLKIRVPLAAGNTGLTNPKTEVDFSQVSWFLNSASELNKAAARDKSKKMTPILSAAEMKELVEVVGNAFLTERNPAPFQISQAMPEITRYSPALVPRIRLKLGAEMSRQLDKVIESNSYYYASQEKSADELAKIADVSAPEVRDARYSTAAFRAVEEGAPEKAQAIAARITDRKNYLYLFEQIQTALPLAKARRGDLDEVRKMLALLKTDRERVEALTELAAALAAKGEYETAKTLLDESLQMTPAQLRKRPELEASIKIAAVYSVAAPENAFTILENNIGQMNQYINSGIKISGFYDAGADEAEELSFNSMHRQVLMYIPVASNLLKNLGRADFERAVSLAEKFERPEIRLYVRLRIAQSMLDANAAEKEKRDREQLTSNEETE